MKHILYTLPLLIGCSMISPKHYTIHTDVVVSEHIRQLPVALDIGFSTTERETLHQAINEWNRVLNGQMKLVIYSDRFNMEDSTLSYILNSNGFLILKVSKIGSVMYNLNDDTIAISDHIGGHIIAI